MGDDGYRLGGGRGGVVLDGVVFYAFFRGFFAVFIVLLCICV